MRDTAHLAGFFAAHGIWCVSDGQTLVPLLGYEQSDGSRGMERFAADDLADAARAGQEALRGNRHDADRAVLVVDGYLHLDTGRTDALIVKAVDHAGARSLTLAVPYRPQQSPAGFAVHRPKFIEVTGVAGPDQRAVAEAFFAGVESHEQAAAVWHDHLDQTG
ncbi:hypothetical protein Q2K19_24705 [Micromonospora soli]|uniref:hypothetical protein n=1 Tax=Micromonospora sp. NBRC 110009 TaxID=3061627 RepID=UPI002671E731|nr:hypothetical protein [Micromonospora sp. NBRC 110009]WKT97351.1 hypothetical protein Q2K19_24705 [Micromonospora sp. NBRC 110009]